MNATEYQSFAAEMYQRAIKNAIETPVIRRYSQDERAILAMHGVTENSRGYEDAAKKLEAGFKNAIEGWIEGFRP